MDISNGFERYSSTQLKGKGIADFILNKVPFPEMHLILQDPRGRIRKASFAGPFTKLNKRLDPRTKQPKDWSKPVNRLDQGAYYHDLAYSYKGKNQKQVRNKADKRLEMVANEVINDPKSSMYNRMNARLVKKVMQKMQQR